MELEQLQLFKSKLKSAENLLQEAENLLKYNKVDIPVEPIDISDCDKISFPRGYIRKRSDFENLFNLRNIVDDDVLQKNISYALQSTDVFHYFLNRFNIEWSAGKIFIKMGMINVLSIIEALLYGTAKNLNNSCRNNTVVCKKAGRCSYYIKSPNKMSFKDVVQLFNNKKILNLATGKVEILLELKEYRDNIHIWEIQNNEYIDVNYDIPNYNNCINLLGEIKEQINSNIMTFRELKSQRCINKTIHNFVQ